MGSIRLLYRAIGAVSWVRTRTSPTALYRGLYLPKNPSGTRGAIPSYTASSVCLRWLRVHLACRAWGAGQGLRSTAHVGATRMPRGSLRATGLLSWGWRYSWASITEAETCL